MPAVAEPSSKSEERQTHSKSWPSNEDRHHVAVEKAQGLEARYVNSCSLINI